MCLRMFLWAGKVEGLLARRLICCISSTCAVLPAVHQPGAAPGQARRRGLRRSRRPEAGAGAFSVAPSSRVTAGPLPRRIYLILHMVELPDRFLWSPGFCPMTNLYTRCLSRGSCETLPTSAMFVLGASNDEVQMRVSEKGGSHVLRFEIWERAPSRRWWSVW
jgi:hypothetical protein